MAQIPAPWALAQPGSEPRSPRPPSLPLELRDKAAMVQNQACRPAPRPPQFPRRSGWGGVGWLAEKDRRKRKEERARGLTSQLLAPRFLRGSMPARPSYSRPSTTCATGRQARAHPERQLPPRPAGQRGAASVRPSVRLRGRGLEGGRPLRPEPRAHPRRRPESPGGGWRGRQVLAVPPEARPFRARWR